MDFIDLIKGEFTGTISIDKLVFSLITAFIIGIFIVFIYKKTFTGVVYSKSFGLCIILLGMITSLIIRTINSNLALSLGMVGALSIVRFRTAVKDPIDTGFMFWGITAGIMSGTGLYLVSIVSSIALGLLYYISYTIGFKMDTHYLIIVKYDISIDSKIVDYISKLGKYKIKSKSIIGKNVELSFETSNKNYDEIINKLSQNQNVESASLISYQNDFGS